MSKLFIPSTFPSTGSIPPACFYNMLGLSTWLNNNPSYKHYFIDYTNIFPGLHPITSSLSSQGYNLENVPLSPFVTNLSQQQALHDRQQLDLFRKVYSYNSNAYINYATVGTTPVYYHFQSYKDYHDYKSSVALVNKLYQFDAMARGQNENRSTLGWIIPFPL